MAVVFVLHAVAVFGLLTTRYQTTRIADREPAMIYLQLPDATAKPSPTPNQKLAPLVIPTPELKPPDLNAIEASTISESIDWSAAAEHAASGANAADSQAPRVFGFPARDTAAPHTPKPFRWDKSRTNRVEQLANGGLTIRLNDRCQAVVAPVFFVGCAPGKIEARGDLFDEMKAPAEFGDWKDPSVRP